MAGRDAAAIRTVSLPDGGGSMTFAWVPPGAFTMGSDGYPTYSATVEGFWMGVYEVTVEQFRFFIEANPAADAVRQLPTEFSERNVNARDAARLVNWPTAVAFCDWAGFALPTEQQWEYAAKGGRNHTYATFDGQMPDYGTHSSGLEVGTASPNPFGIHDMSGNIWEWCLEVLSDGQAVLRGGADASLDYERYTFHNGTRDANNESDWTGFRCVLQSSPAPKP
jgi:formylglycine-generating enzyme required for sulfatase activity